MVQVALQTVRPRRGRRGAVALAAVVDFRQEQLARFGAVGGRVACLAVQLAMAVVIEAAVGKPAIAGGLLGVAAAVAVGRAECEVYIGGSNDDAKAKRR